MLPRDKNQTIIHDHKQCSKPCQLSKSIPPWSPTYFLVLVEGCSGLQGTLAFHHYHSSQHQQTSPQQTEQHRVKKPLPAHHPKCLLPEVVSMAPNLYAHTSLTSCTHSQWPAMKFRIAPRPIVSSELQSTCPAGFPTFVPSFFYPNFPPGKKQAAAPVSLESRRKRYILPTPAQNVWRRLACA